MPVGMHCHSHHFASASLQGERWPLGHFQAPARALAASGRYRCLVGLAPDAVLRALAGLEGEEGIGALA